MPPPSLAPRADGGGRIATAAFDGSNQLSSDLAGGRSCTTGSAASASMSSLGEGLGERGSGVAPEGGGVGLPGGVAGNAERSEGISGSCAAKAACIIIPLIAGPGSIPFAGAPAPGINRARSRPGGDTRLAEHVGVETKLWRLGQPSRGAHAHQASARFDLNRHLYVAPQGQLAV